MCHPCHPCMRTCGWCLELSVFFLVFLVFYFLSLFLFQLFLMSTSAPDERSVSNPLCDSSLGSVVTSVTLLTGFQFPPLLRIFCSSPSLLLLLFPRTFQGLPLTPFFILPLILLGLLVHFILPDLPHPSSCSFGSRDPLHHQFVILFYWFSIVLFHPRLLLLSCPGNFIYGRKDSSIFFFHS